MVIFKRILSVRIKTLSCHFTNCLSFWYRAQLTSVGSLNSSVYKTAVHSSFLSQDLNTFERCCIMRLENLNSLHNTDGVRAEKNPASYTSTLVCPDVVTETRLRIICIGVPVSTLLDDLQA